MKPAHHWFALRIRLIALLTHAVACFQSYGQTAEQIDAVNASLEKIFHSVPFGNDAAVQQVVLSLTSEYGREAAAQIICRVTRDRTLDVDQLYATRLVGNAFQPEFSKAVFQALQDNADPLAAGRLLRLLRDAPPEDAKGVALWLSDDRPAEELPRRAREVRGAVAYRVCDVAYNVLKEIQATDKSKIQVLTRSESIAQREALIAPLRGKSSYPPKPNSADEVAPKTGFTTPNPDTQASEPSDASKPEAADIATLPASRVSKWLPWAGAAIILAAAAGWLFLRLRGKKN